MNKWDRTDYISVIGAAVIYVACMAMALALTSILPRHPSTFLVCIFTLVVGLAVSGLPAIAWASYWESHKARWPYN